MSSIASRAFYDVVPISPRYAQPHTHKPFEVFRKMSQGAGAGFLGISGVDAVGTPGAFTNAGAFLDFSSFEGIMQSLSAGAAAGPMQLILAAILFLAAGKCVARLAGVIAVGAAYFLYSQGVGVPEVATFADHFVQRMGAAVQAFMSAKVA